MPNSDDDDCAQYGTALDPIEEDDAAKKRPVGIQDQIAVDERGRRRFHGAFTGGFSAGYFNTVGSKEGWAPSTFKSSRSDRNNLRSQNVMDFMDDEDKGAFGIAPQVLRPTDEFTDKNESRGKKRPWQGEAEGPIPGVPVLDQIIQPVKETVGIKILVKMGWRPGKGVGAKVDKRERVKRAKKAPKEAPTAAEEQEDMISNTTNDPARTYGCSLPPEFSKDANESDESLDDIIDAEALLAPDDVRSLLCNPKQNTFGLGYKGLDRNTLTPASGHVDLFGSKLKFRVENKNMSISGQAFGVGAFEEHDEDIYSKEDMSQYDFALETPDERRRRKAKEEHDKRRGKNKENCLEGFRISSSAKLKRKHYSAPTLPANFEPYHVTKKSRFEATGSNEEKQEVAAKGLSRHNLTISERQVLIEDDPSKIKEIQKDTSALTVVSTAPSDDNDKNRSVESKPASKSNEDIQRRIERLKRFTQVLQAYGSKKPQDNEKVSFKPFMKNPEKQERYEKYITLAEAGFSECLRDLQPIEMTEWERDREKMEFDRASKLYKPMSSILSNRFTSAKSHDISHLEPEKEAVLEKDPKDDPKVAGKMKLFGRLTHNVMEWHPEKLVCKRFNIPHPYPDSKFVGVINFQSVSGASAGETIGKSTHAVPVAKKSLFDNLDFSKPPPGLLPPESMQPSGFQENPTEGSAEVDGMLVSSTSTSKPVLEFHKEMATSKSANEDDEIITVEKPPLDLFKEIFADSSESEEEDEDMESEPVLRVFQGRENESQHFVSQHTLQDDGVRDDKSSDKIVPSNDRKSFPAENESVNQKDGSRRGVFDRIDLDRLHGHIRNQNMEKDCTKMFTKSTESDEDMDDIYGPRPPTSSTTQPHSIASVSSSKRSTTVSSSSTSMNYRSQSKPDDTKKEVSREEVIWVEKSALSDGSSKSHVKSKKHSSKSHRKSSKKEKRKTRKSKRHKHKKKGHKHKSSGKHNSTESSSEGDDGLSDSGASSNSSVTINDSLDNRALLAKLKQITRSN